MSKETKEQVQLFKLLFTMNWEDPASDARALNIQPGDSVSTVTSGGCNTLGFLRYDPSRIYAVDINPTQTYLMELKMAGMKNLSYQEFIAFCGLEPSANRLATYSGIRHSLSDDAASYWDSQRALLAKGFLFKGRFEHFVGLAGRFIKLLEGRKRVEGLFGKKDAGEQARFFHEVWKDGRMKAVFNLLFNKWVLAKRGLAADYFHFDDGAGSFSESFHNRFRKVLLDIPVYGNYFLAAYLLGRYHTLSEVPDYLHPDHYETIRARLDRVELFTADTKEWLASWPSDRIDCFALSNICELMSLNDTERLFREVWRTGKNDARIVFRNLMIPREVPEILRDNIRKDEALSHVLLATDRSFVYSKVAAYMIKK